MHLGLDSAKLDFISQPEIMQPVEFLADNKVYVQESIIISVWKSIFQVCKQGGITYRVNLDEVGSIYIDQIEPGQNNARN